MNARNRATVTSNASSANAETLASCSGISSGCPLPAALPIANEAEGTRAEAQHESSALPQRGSAAQLGGPWTGARAGHAGPSAPTSAIGVAASGTVTTASDVGITASG